MLQIQDLSRLSIQKQQINGKDYTMELTTIESPIANIKHGIYTAEQDFYHTVYPTRDSILTCSCLQGSSLTLNHDNLDIQEQGSLLFQETAVPYEHLMKTDKNKKGEFLEIAVNQNYIAHLFAEERDYLAELLNQQSSKLHFDLNLNSLQVLQQLIANPYQGKLAIHYVENKVEEMHLLHYSNWRYAKEQKAMNLHKKDEDALYEIKHFITENYNQEFTLQELAHRIGINQTKLKTGFKTLFGTTTFKYIHDLRMQKALELIQTKNYSIYEIAEFVGYKHSQHFTAAFKKYYGQLPTQVK